MAGSSSLASWLVPAIGSLVGVVIGGFLTYWASDTLADKERVLGSQFEIYADYVKAQARYSIAQTPEAIEAAKPPIREAAFRLAIMAPTEVVRSVASFTRDVGPRGACTLPAGDIGVYQAIRDSMLNDRYEPVTDSDLAMILFGCVLPAN